MSLGSHSRLYGSDAFTTVAALAIFLNRAKPLF